MTVTPAVEGETFSLRDEEQTVGPKCEENRGSWFCTTHGEGFANNMSKDSHTQSGTHVLAWICVVHGAEVP